MSHLQIIDKEQFWINFVPKLDTNLNLFCVVVHWERIDYELPNWHTVIDKLMDVPKMKKLHTSNPYNTMHSLQEVINLRKYSPNKAQVCNKIQFSPLNTLVTILNK